MKKILLLLLVVSCKAKKETPSNTDLSLYFKQLEWEANYLSISFADSSEDKRIFWSKEAERYGDSAWTYILKEAKEEKEKKRQMLKKTEEEMLKIK